MKTILRRMKLGGLVAVLCACASVLAAPAKKISTNSYSFYPPEPDEPRLQFLTYFDSSKDFAKNKGSKFMTFLTGKSPGTLIIAKPYGGAARNGVIYVCDTGSAAVMRLDIAQQKMDAIIGSGPVNFTFPVNLAVDEDDSLYVVDLSLNQLVIMDKDEKLLGSYGVKGQGKYMDVALTKDKIYLSDVLGHCVHVLDKSTRKVLFDIPRQEDATNYTRKLFQPLNIAVDKEGWLYVSDFGANHVQVYDADGKWVRSIGQKGDNFGEFTRAKGVAVDRDDRVYVVEAAGHMVQLFDKQGQLLMWFGENSRDRVNLFLPSKVFLDYDDVKLFQKYAAPNFEIEHLVIVLNQFGPMKVDVFGFGHKKS